MSGPPPISGLNLDQHGAALHAQAAATLIPALERLLAPCPTDRAGTRLHDVPGIADLLTADAPIGALAATHLGAETRPIRAILFDKSARTNLSAGWHQDRTVPGYGRWSITPRRRLPSPSPGKASRT